MKHTPGKWIVINTYKKGKKTGLSIHPCHFYFQGEISDTVRTDAALIAAAPEMFEALCAIREGFKNGSIKFTRCRKSDLDPYHPANTKMCAAIAKAEGR
jgi:hypothetical protein